MFGEGGRGGGPLMFGGAKEGEAGGLHMTHLWFCVQ